MMRERSTVSVEWLCIFFEKSRQAYYQICHRKDSVSADTEVIVNYVKDIRTRMPKIGTRKLHHLLQPVLKKTAIKCGRDKLFSILGDTGLLQPKHSANRCFTKSLPLSRSFPNLIKDMTIDAPEQVWVSDTTGFPVRDGLVFITFTTDSYSKQIMGYNVQHTKDRSGSLATLRMALGNRKYPERQLIHHSDGGGEYFNKTFVDVLLAAHVKMSCTAPSSPEENSVAERINGIFKTELLLTEDNRTSEAVSENVPKVVKIYNEERPHSSIDFMTPVKAHNCHGILRKRWKTYAKHQKSGEKTMSEGKRILQEMNSWT